MKFAKKLFLVLVLIAVFCGVSGCKRRISRLKRVYVVAIDPTWYPLDVRGFQRKLQAFSTDLIKAIANEEDIIVEIRERSWTEINIGLRLGKIDAALSPLHPSTITKSEFSFSDAYLFTGPVLVVPKDASIHSLDDLKGQFIGVRSDLNTDVILETHPTILIKRFDSITRAFEAVDRGVVDAVLFHAFPAYYYSINFYENKFKVVTYPLTNEGLRLITDREKYPELIEKFNRGLKKLLEDEEYGELLDKWGLDLKISINNYINN